MAQPGQRNEDRRPPSILTRAGPPDDEAQGNQREAQRNRGRKLAGKRGCDVPAVDVERAVEGERETRNAQDGGARETKPAKMAQSPRGDREHHDAAHGHEFERNVVRKPDEKRRNNHESDRKLAGERVASDHTRVHGPTEQPQDDGDGQDRMKPDVEKDDQERRDHHVEVERRKSRVPVGRPPRQLKLGKQFVAKERRTPDVCAHVTPGWGGVGEDQIRLQLPEDEQSRAENDHGGNRAFERIRPRGRGPAGVGRRHCAILPSRGSDVVVSDLLNLTIRPRRLRG